MIGTDICNPKRIEKVYKKFGTKFLKRIFTPAEIDEINNLSKNKKNFFQRIAARFAAKEAVAKVLGTGIGEHLSFQDFSIQRDVKGVPRVLLNERSQKLLESLNLNEIKLSISHEENLAIAFALGIRNQ